MTNIKTNYARQLREDLCGVTSLMRGAKIQLGDTVKKIKGSQWHGTVVGTYSTTLTPEGYCVESSTEKGSVQIYPAAALELDK